MHHILLRMDLVERAWGAVILSAVSLENPASPNDILTVSGCGAAICPGPGGNCLTVVVGEESPSWHPLGMIDGQIQDTPEPRLGWPSQSPKEKLGCWIDAVRSGPQGGADEVGRPTGPATAGRECSLPGPRDPVLEIQRVRVGFSPCGKRVHIGRAP